MKKLLLFALLFVGWNTYAQTQVYNQENDQLFGQLNQSRINTGILLDYGMEFSDLENLPNQQMSITEYRMAYATLLSSVANQNQSLVHIKDLNQRLENFQLANPEVVPLNAFVVDYQKFNDNALSAGYLGYNGTFLYDQNNSQLAYQQARAFSFSSPVQADADGSVVFHFPDSLFVNSTSATSPQFWADWGNGAGYQAISFNTDYPVNYSTEGLKQLKLKIQLDGIIQESRMQFLVDRKPPTSRPKVS